MNSQPQSDNPIREGLRNFWKENAAWRNDLERKSAYMALDVPEEGMINAPKTNVGIGSKEIISLGVVGAGILALWSFLNPSEQTQSQPQQPQSPAAAIQLFYDDPVDGPVPLRGAASEEGAKVGQ